MDESIKGRSLFKKGALLRAVQSRARRVSLGISDQTPTTMRLVRRRRDARKASLRGRPSWLRAPGIVITQED